MEGNCEYQEFHDTLEITKDELRSLLTVAITLASTGVRLKLHGRKPQFATTAEIVEYIMTTKGLN